MQALPADSPPAGDRVRLWLALVLVVSCAVYAPALVNGFTFDDAWYASARTPFGVPNPMVAELQPLADYFTKPMGWGLDYNCRGYRPVTVLSYALVHAVTGGAEPEPAWLHHLVNLVLHGLATLLVFRLVRLLASSGPALVAALCFGVHALHTEAVVWIVGRAELLGFVLGAAGVLALHRASFRPALLPVPAICFFLAFCSKESAVAWAGFAPLVVLAAQHVRGGGATWRRNVLSWAAAVGLPLLVFFVLRHGMLVAHVAPKGPFQIAYEANPIFHLPLLERAPTALMLLGLGVYKCLAPIELCCSYGFGALVLATGWLDPRVLVSVAVLLAALVLAWRWRGAHPLLALGVAGFLGFAFITSNLAVPIETIFAERLYYTPAIAVALLAAHAAARAEGFRARMALALVLVPWLLVNSALSVTRSLEWYDDRTLFYADAAKRSDCIELLVNLAAVKFDELDTKGGEECLRRAIAVGPRIPRPRYELATCLYEVGTMYERGKKREEARKRYAEAAAQLEAAAASPLMIPALDGGQIYGLLAELYKRLGRPEDAARARALIASSSPRPRAAAAPTARR